ncbi:MAG: diacylglycerol kinase family lipid kinase [Candidatus Dormibacteria bacterium]
MAERGDPAVVAIVNPSSGRGRTGRRWPEALAALELAGLHPRVWLTSEREDATRLTREAVAGGAATILAVGGDGTLSEVVNGLFDATGRQLRRVTVGVVPGGSGGDFRRSLAIPNSFSGAAAVLAAGHVRSLDLGRVTYADASVRHFVNIADCGVGGEVVARVNGRPRRLGGSALFLYHALSSLMTYAPRRVRLDVDGEVLDTSVQNVVFANAQYFGGGMRVAPHADPADGLLDVVVIGASSRPSTLLGMARIYRGRHLSHPGVVSLRGRLIRVQTLTDGAPLRFDVDGEDIGTTPVSVECLPGALRLLAPPPAGPAA